MANLTAHFSSVVLLAAALVGDAWAQTSPSQPAPAARESNAPSTDAYRVANRTMIQGKTNSKYTGDADFDFVAQMAPHTQVAVDLAKVELQYGTDPSSARWLRALCIRSKRSLILCVRGCKPISQNRRQSHEPRLADARLAGSFLWNWRKTDVISERPRHTHWASRIDRLRKCYRRTSRLNQS